MTINEKIDVLCAFRDGKKIECRWNKDGMWTPASTPTWDFVNFDYRVKRVAKEWWVKPEVLEDNNCPLFDPWNAGCILVRKVDMNP